MTDMNNDVTAGKEDKNMTDVKKKSKLPIILGVVAVVLIALVIAGLKWHEQPSFCNAICHSPMDKYVEEWDGNDETLLLTQHKNMYDCLDCHNPGIQAQLQEAQHFITGNFTDPLPKVNMGNDFCLNPECHSGISSYDELEAKTEGLEFNPHSQQHGEQECASCHRMHDQSVVYCTQCHSDAAKLIDSSDMTKGWLTVDQAKEQGLDVVGL